MVGRSNLDSLSFQPVEWSDKDDETDMNTHPYTTDTSKEAQDLQLELVRKMSPAERLNRALSLSSDLVEAAKAAIRRRHPNLSDREVGLKFIELHYGAELAAGVRATLEAST